MCHLLWDGHLVRGKNGRLLSPNNAACRDSITYRNAEEQPSIMLLPHFPRFLRNGPGGAYGDDEQRSDENL